LEVEEITSDKTYQIPEFMRTSFGIQQIDEVDDNDHEVNIEDQAEQQEPSDYIAIDHER
jgi:hypothetical protein